MTRQELRVFLDGWFCGCGVPAESSARLRDLLALHPLWNSQAELNAMLPDDGLRYLVLYTLDHFGLSEHGSGIGGAYLTEKGQAVLGALNRESADDFEALHTLHCCHGYAVDTEIDNCPECSKLNAR